MQNANFIDIDIRFKCDIHMDFGHPFLFICIYFLKVTETRRSKNRFDGKSYPETTLNPEKPPIIAVKTFF